jgi:hypothetical protein
MIKQLLLVTVCSLTCVLTPHLNAASSQSHTGSDHFTDNMYILGPAGTRILDLNSIYLTVKKINDTYFQIIGSPGHTDGTVIAKIGTDANHYAILSIYDSRDQNNPDLLIANEVGGFKFNTMQHPWSTFTYRLKFSQTP